MRSLLRFNSGSQWRRSDKVANADHNTVVEHVFLEFFELRGLHQFVDVAVRYTAQSTHRVGCACKIVLSHLT